MSTAATSAQRVGPCESTHTPAESAPRVAQQPSMTATLSPPVNAALKLPEGELRPKKGTFFDCSQMGLACEEEKPPPPKRRKGGAKRR